MPGTFLVSSSDEFQNAALQELRQQDHRLKPGENLAPGLFLVTSSFSEYDFAAMLTQQPPIYVRHLFPVQATIPLTKTNEDLERLAETASNLPRLSELPAETPFAVQARLIEEEGKASAYAYTPYAIKEKLSAVIAEKTGAVENVREPLEILSVVCVNEKAYLGLSLAELNLSSWPGGMRRFAKRPEQISRAELKLEEALEVFDISLPSSGEALDLGAAPGGWSRILLEAGMDVTAVDPAELDPRLQAYGKRLSHYQGHAERFLENALANKSRLASFDVIAGDLRMDAAMAARLLVAYAPLLKPGGFVITTLKLPHETSKLKPAQLAENALAILKSKYSQIHAHQLFHNRQEITVYLRK
ncbi:MAG TPA: SAM-dependent methyltransferase [Chloroflexia bacterium]|nr:SAM-dependent methyltransferase [Chloroflexia bacterium]